jgi:hypothetical protein
MHPNIAEGQRSQERIRYGMRKHVGIGVAFESELARYCYAA